MNILVHAEELNRSHADGTHQYIKAVLGHFEALEGTLEAVVRVQPPASAIPRQTTVRVLPWHAPAWTELRFGPYVRRHAPEICWVPLQHLPRVRSSYTKYVVTVHDLAYLRTPESFAPTVRKKLAKKMRYAATHADALLCVSEQTRRDVIATFPDAKEKCAVVHHGIASEYRVDQQTEQDVLRQYDLSAERYIVTVNTITHPRKGIATLIKAFEKVAVDDQEVALVIVGRDGYRAEEVHAQAERSPYKARIIFTGAVSHAVKTALIKNAQVFVYPSLYEGFGMSVLESLQLGTPVVTAENSSLTEVGGDAVAYFQTDNADDLARQLQGAHTFDEARAAAQLAKFSWQKCATETKQLFEQLTT